MGANVREHASRASGNGQAMNTQLIDAIAKAVLYEGYMLYPYKASSVKNRQRWTFGSVYPQTWADWSGSDASPAQVKNASPASVKASALFFTWTSGTTLAFSRRRNA